MAKTPKHERRSSTSRAIRAARGGSVIERHLQDVERMTRLIRSMPFAPRLAERFGMLLDRLYHETIKEPLFTANHLWFLIRTDEELERFLSAFRATVGRYERVPRYRKLILCVYKSVSASTREGLGNLHWFRHAGHGVRSFLVENLEDIRDIPSGRIRNPEHQWRISVLQTLRSEARAMGWDQEPATDAEEARRQERYWMNTHEWLLGNRHIEVQGLAIKRLASDEDPSGP